MNPPQHHVHVTTDRLADGRGITYYDETAGRTPASDRRELPEPSPATELRHDPLRDEWVVVAAHRQGRTFLPPTTDCPLCPSAPDRHTEIPETDYDVVVFENRFPSLATGVPGVAPAVDGEQLLARRPGRGRCEVVCFTPDHDVSFGELSTPRVRTVIEAWADRTAHLNALPEVEQVYCFENRGEEIGVTLGHPHGQIYAYPFVTPTTARELATARTYGERTGRNLFDDVLAAERRAGTRMVLETEHWSAFVPAAARWPYEVHLYPNERVPDLPALPEAARAELARVYPSLVRRFDELFPGRVPYIAAWHQAPSRTGRDIAGLRLELFTIRRAAGKLKYLAGSESGMAVWINDVAPEHAAERLREVS